MRKSQLKSMLILFLIFISLSILVYAVSTTLITAENTIDDDGFLDLRASCEPQSQNDFDGTTVWNLTNGTLYSNVDGTWKANATINITGFVPANATYFFNFTNHINQSAEGEFQWNVKCSEENVSDNSKVQTSFAGNKTIRVEYARTTAETTSPFSGIHSLNGHAIPVVCTGRPSSNWNITNISLYTDQTGSWQINSTFTPVSALGVEVVANFTINGFGNASIADGNTTLFSCSFTQVRNDQVGGATSEKSSLNRTLNVEYPPQVTLNNPADNNWSKNRLVSLNYTIVSAFGSSIAPFKTRIFTNETGDWLPRTGTINADNNTDTLRDYTFPELTAILWNIEAKDANNGAVFNFSTNRTINIDSINPTVSNVTENSTQDNTSILQFLPTDINLAGVILYVNYTTNGHRPNYTNVSAELTTGELIIHSPTESSNGVFVYSITVNDSSGRTFSTDNFSLIVDTVPPALSSITNVSSRACDTRNITWTTNENANHTFRYDTDSVVSDGTVIIDSTSQTSHSALLDFDLNREITHTFNISVTDIAGNENSTQVTFQTPASVCAGWSQYGVYDALINLSLIQNQSGADLVYFWNASAQDWVFHTAGLSANGGVDMGKKTGYNVVHLFEDTNSTWYRNTTNDGVYRYNVSVSNNFVNVPIFYSFGNYTYRK